jgi:Terpene cyclase DEP1
MHPIRLILIAGLLCLCSLAFSQTPSPAAFKELQELQSAQQKKLDELATTNAALAKSVQDKTIAIEQAAIFKNIETDRKSIEWWFAALGIMTTVVAALSAFFPFFLGLKEKELLKAQLENARDLVNSIKDQHGVAIKTVEKIDQLRSFNSGNNASQSDADAQGIAKELKAVTNNPQQYSPEDRLWARAVQASQATSPTREQSQQAYDLWKAFTLLDTSDANAQFNAGYFAHELAKNEPPLAQKMFAQACSHYEQALAIKPDMHDAAINWGIALSEQANALNSQDPEAAQALWAQAATKYAKALAIKPNEHDAANNWGNTLNAQAKALNNQDPEAAQALWAQAATKYAQALAIKPDLHEAAYNWGITLNAQAKALNNQDPEAAQALWAQAATKYAQALAIKPDMHDAAINWGIALSEQAKALNSQDPQAAQALLAQAVTKYAQALAIKPDMHEAAYNWGITLNAQANALNSQNPKAAQELWVQAAELFARYAKDVPVKMSFKLACVYSRLNKLDVALDQLEVCRAGDSLPDYWRTDDDLANLRTTDAYEQWKKKHFPAG